MHMPSKDKYIGFTGNLEQRLIDHNSGNNPSTKRKEGKWDYTYYEAFLSKKDAIERENRLKGNSRSKQELYKRIYRSFEEIAN